MRNARLDGTPQGTSSLTATQRQMGTPESASASSAISVSEESTPQKSVRPVNYRQWFSRYAWPVFALVFLTLVLQFVALKQTLQPRKLGWGKLVISEAFADPSVIDSWEGLRAAKARPWAAVPPELRDVYEHCQSDLLFHDVFEETELLSYAASKSDGDKFFLDPKNSPQNSTDAAFLPSWITLAQEIQNKPSKIHIGYRCNSSQNSCGGLADRLKAWLSVYKFASGLGIKFTSDWSFPPGDRNHGLLRYLQPHKIDWHGNWSGKPVELEMNLVGRKFSVAVLEEVIGNVTQLMRQCDETETASICVVWISGWRYQVDIHEVFDAIEELYPKHKTRSSLDDHVSAPMNLNLADSATAGTTLEMGEVGVHAASSYRMAVRRLSRVSWLRDQLETDAPSKFAANNSIVMTDGCLYTTLFRFASHSLHLICEEFRNTVQYNLNYRSMFDTESYLDRIVRSYLKPCVAALHLNEMSLDSRVRGNDQTEPSLLHPDEAKETSTLLTYRLPFLDELRRNRLLYPATHKLAVALIQTYTYDTKTFTFGEADILREFNLRETNEPSDVSMNGVPQWELAWSVAANLTKQPWTAVDRRLVAVHVRKGDSIAFGNIPWQTWWEQTLKKEPSRSKREHLLYVLFKENGVHDLTPLDENGFLNCAETVSQVVPRSSTGSAAGSAPLPVEDYRYIFVSDVPVWVEVRVSDLAEIGYHTANRVIDTMVDYPIPWHSGAVNTDPGYEFQDRVWRDLVVMMTADKIVHSHSGLTYIAAAFGGHALSTSYALFESSTCTVARPW